MLPWLKSKEVRRGPAGSICSLLSACFPEGPEAASSGQRELQSLLLPPSTSQLGGCLQRSSPKHQRCLERRLWLVLCPGKVLTAVLDCSGACVRPGTKTLPLGLGWGRGAAGNGDAGACPLPPLCLYISHSISKDFCATFLQGCAQAARGLASPPPFPWALRTAVL